METISDISQTATLEVKFERSLDQLEAAWNVSGKPNDIPIWEQEERDYQALVAQQDQKRQQQQQQQISNDSPTITHTTTITTTKLPSPPSPPICEVLSMSFLFVPRLHSYVLHNPDELCRVLEDHVVTTIKLSASPYALPFEQRVKELRARQDSLLEWVFVWMEMQRTWLELKPLHLQGKLKIKTKLQELFVKCDLKIKKIRLKYQYFWGVVLASYKSKRVTIQTSYKSKRVTIVTRMDCGSQSGFIINKLGISYSLPDAILFRRILTRDGSICCKKYINYRLKYFFV